MYMTSHLLLPGLAFKRSITRLFKRVVRIHYADITREALQDCSNLVLTPLYRQRSHVLPEEVVLFKFKCYISALEYTSRSSSHEAGKRIVTRDWRPPLKLTASLQPHYVHDERQQASYADGAIGDDDEESIDVSIQQVCQAIRSNAINCFLHQPQIKKYSIRWVTRHCVAKFDVKKRKRIRSRCAQNQQADPGPDQVQRQGGKKGHRQGRPKLRAGIQSCQSNGYQWMCFLNDAQFSDGLYL
ncbi:hypothetical protein BAE44_0015203 [Dichanthelium oligosanthes]|uniref:Uncharacterized protein n=1 Tax=Dichanthelium oligosanthes TaxID=888268 RepID=A0A1E5VF53_9POAL|nr:hypothetical protein BAE44_0015203 [Dichanthelium oligosanthes]